MPDWTSKEIRVLKAKRHKMTYAELAKIMPHTEGAIKNMSQKYNLRGPESRGRMLCERCRKVYGECSWTEIDAITGKVKFVPVPGWTAKKNENGYLVLKCPEFVQDERWDVT